MHRDPSRIPSVLGNLEALWRRNPELRLGQIIVGIRRRTGLADCWWKYCAEHLYGRWIENGAVMFWRLVPIEEMR